MEFVYITLTVAVIIGVFFFLCFKAAETESIGWALAILLYVSALIAVAVMAKMGADKKGPCMQYETRMMYNAATKTNMPAKVCIERGEWVTEENKYEH